MATNPIKYGLRENLLTADPDDCMGRNLRLLTEFAVRQTRANSCREFLHSKNSISTRSVRHINKEMAKRGTSLTEADIAAYQKLEEAVYKDIIENGGHINTPLINTSFSITGVFTNQTDSFDKSRHAIKLNVNAGSVLREAAAKATAQKVESASTDPYITSVTDKVTGDSATIKAGSVMEVTGSRLKFDATDTEQGVFALTGAGEIRCATVIENKPARLLVLLPADIAAGDFTVEVRTKLTGTRGASGKTLKKGGFNKTLTAVKD